MKAREIVAAGEDRAVGRRIVVDGVTWRIVAADLMKHEGWLRTVALTCVQVGNPSRGAGFRFAPNDDVRVPRGRPVSDT